MTNRVDLDEVAHVEPPHQDLCCLQVQLFSFLVLKKKVNTSVHREPSPVILSYLLLLMIKCQLPVMKAK